MRLDLFLTENNNFPTRSKSAEAIKKGLVSVNGKIVDKPAKEVTLNDDVKLNGNLKFVSKGGYKLEKGIDELNIPVEGKIFADIGASTGGFTDCLLQKNAKMVFAVDVGENQLDQKIKGDKRVVVLDNTNARYLKVCDFHLPLNGIVVDCSFISLKLLLPTFSQLLDDKGILVGLIKPQFEVGSKNLPKSGVLRDYKKRSQAVLDVIDCAFKYNFYLRGITEAPVYKDKNIEYIVYFDRSGNCLKQDEVLNILKG